MSPTRRTLLDRTARVLGGGTLVSLAGCLGGTDRTAGRTATDAPSETATSPTAAPTNSDFDFIRWLPSPAGTPYRDGYGVSYVDAAAVRARHDALHENASEHLESELSYVLPPARVVDPADVDAAFRFAFSTSVVFGSFDPSTFGERLQDRRAGHKTSATSTNTRTETATATPAPRHYGDFTLFGDDPVYAVSTDALVQVGGFADGDLDAYAKAVVDAQAGDAARYADANAYAEALFGLVDAPHALTCYVEAMDGSSSRGFRKDVITGGLRSWRFGSTTTHLTYGNTYPDEEAAKAAGFEEYLEEESARFGAYADLDVQRERFTVWADGTIPTRQFDFLSAGGPGDGVHTPND